MGINNEYSLLQMFDNWWDNVEIYYANITWFYMVSMTLTWLAVGLSSWKYFPLGCKKQNADREENKEEGMFEKESKGCFSLQTQYKLAKQKIAEKHLTPEQRSREKEAEAKQLAAILKLLQEQSETFQVDSMDQLENQLRLYRS